MPTLANMIGLPLASSSFDGHCLGEAPGASCTPR
jgi:hypothetical protein